MLTKSPHTIAQLAIDRTNTRASVLVDRDFIVRWASPSIEFLLKYTVDEFVGTAVFDHLHPDDLQAIADILAFEQDIDVSARVWLTARSVREVQARRADGSYLVLEASLSNFFDDPEIGMLLVDLQLPTQFRFADRAIELTRLGADLHETLSVVLLELTAADPWQIACAIFDDAGELLTVTPYAPEPFGTRNPEDYRTTWEIDLTEAGSAEPVGRLRVWSYLPKPHPLDVESSVRVAGHAALVIGRYHALQELQRAAQQDALTGVANRRVLEGMLSAHRDPGEEVLVVYLDLDGFKDVNDSLGHEAGDIVLVTVANRLRNELRSEDVVARVGGDEFVLVFASPIPDADTIRQRLEAIVATPISIGDRTVSVTASIGTCSGAPIDDDLVRIADEAMLTLKALRRVG
jgi:diguanylate cyclase (GGDEF)-like protein